MKSSLHIAYNQDCAADHFCEQCSDLFGDVDPARSSYSDAGARNVYGVNFGFGAGLTDRAGQRFASAHFSQTNDVAPGGKAAAQDRSLVAENAHRLTAAAIDAEKQSHSVVLAQGLQRAR